MKTRHYVGREEEIPEGGRKIVEIGKRSIGVFRVGGAFYALLNVCPHQFAPLCAGRICGYSPPSAVGEFRYEREGEIIRCPWHGWEFDIKTGRSIFNPHAVRTASYRVVVGEGDAPGVETFPVIREGAGLFVEI